MLEQRLDVLHEVELLVRGGGPEVVELGRRIVPSEFRHRLFAGMDRPAAKSPKVQSHERPARLTLRTETLHGDQGEEHLDPGSGRGEGRQFPARTDTIAP